MPYLTNSIGTFQFIWLKGQPLPPAEQIARPMVRAGVDGIGLKRTGVRGRPFVMQSMVDTVSLVGAGVLWQAYRGLIGADPVGLIHNGLQYAGEGWDVAVLDVRQLVARSVVTPTGGGKNPPSLGKLVCEWDLIAKMT